MPERKAAEIEKEIDELLLTIHKVYGYDFTDYSRASINRRVRKFVDDEELENVSALNQKIVHNTELFESFLQKITVNVTEMFRDPEFYRVIRSQILPVIASYPTIKIWHAGCSTGEEVFSMAILLHEAGLLNRSKIYATDINRNNIEKAKKGILPLDVMKDYVSNYIQSGGEKDFASYYMARYDRAMINKDLRTNIIFLQHNLVTDQVFNEFQIIFCRNVMIYFNHKLQNKVVRLLHSSLSRFGYLALGVKESLLFTEVKNNFEVISKPDKVFRRIR